MYKAVVRSVDSDRMIVSFVLNDISLSLSRELSLSNALTANFTHNPATQNAKTPPDALCMDGVSRIRKNVLDATEPSRDPSRPALRAGEPEVDRPCGLCAGETLQHLTPVR